MLRKLPLKNSTHATHTSEVSVVTEAAVEAFVLSAVTEEVADCVRDEEEEEEGGRVGLEAVSLSSRAADGVS